MKSRTSRTRRAPRSLSHLEAASKGGASRMVDVSKKRVSSRSALARAAIVFPPGLLERVLAAQGPKGAVEEVARAAGMLAAKRTGELIPMCHPLGLDHLSLEFVRAGRDRLEVRCRAACRGRTGVEMEAMTGAAVAALVIYDMTKGLDHGIRIEALELLEKRGGKSGTWKAAKTSS
ncbi:MAG: cyclic pyranopterin monophosphate synthase MoaC [Planctomycetes bacterium]|nr:cyclic pyranopterin monophosphate synthase MoaC [Planctomycetota bacterium]